jgi:hypothetical protein
MVIKGPDGVKQGWPAVQGKERLIFLLKEETERFHVFVTTSVQNAVLALPGACCASLSGSVTPLRPPREMAAEKPPVW